MSSSTPKNNQPSIYQNKSEQKYGSKPLQNNPSNTNLHIDNFDGDEDIDIEKVNKIIMEIDRGELKIDSTHLAEKIIEMEKELSKKKK